MLRGIHVIPNQMPKDIILKKIEDIKKILGSSINVKSINNEEANIYYGNGTMDGKCLLNRFVDKDFIFGDFIILRNRNGKPKSLTDKQIIFYKNEFNKDSIEYATKRLELRKRVRKFFLRR